MKCWTQYRARFVAEHGLSMAADGRIARFSDLVREYDALALGPAIVDRSNRAILEITGADRARWLHNLTTNVVKTLAPGDGNYSLATNVAGRILFDLNVLVRKDLIRLDVDRCFLREALAHFGKYVIIEDVVVHDRRDDVVVFGVVGDRAGEVAATLGVSQMAAMADLGSTEVTVDDTSCLLVRNNFCGPPAFELHVPDVAAPGVWGRLIGGVGGAPAAVPVGAEAVEVRRIEAGIPWPGAEITSEYLPAETMQFDRAVSFQKGCYLGQEVIERMRTRDKVARRLVRFEVGVGTVAAPGDSVWHEGKAVGTITSFARGIGSASPSALGYVKTAASEPGTSVVIRAEAGDLDATVTALQARGMARSAGGAAAGRHP